MNYKSFKQLDEEIKICEKCSLCETRTQVVTGRGSINNCRVLWVGEAPGKDEDEQGKPFVGRSGKLLDIWIDYINLSKLDYAITNIVKCRPPNNRNPKVSEIEACSDWIEYQIDFLRPEIIVTIGKFSSVYFLGKKFENGITTYSGKFYKNKDRRLIYPVVHPSYYIRHGSEVPNDVYDWRKQLEALKLSLRN